MVVPGEFMRLFAVIILLSLTLGILVPPVLSMTFAQDGVPCIGTLDVCHSAVPALASCGEMPCVNQSFPCGRPPVSIITFDQAGLLFHLVAFPSDIEQPPRT
jgi:hypothetical protein